MTVYVSIGNSDDKLTQAEWAIFHGGVNALIATYAGRVHDRWTSISHEAWQNACWAFDVDHPANAEVMKRELSQLAAQFKQDSIAWADATTTFLKPGEQE